MSRNATADRISGRQDHPGILLCSAIPSLHGEKQSDSIRDRTAKPRGRDGHEDGRLHGPYGRHLLLRLQWSSRDER